MPRSTNSSKPEYAAAARHISLPSRIDPCLTSCGLPLAGPWRRSQAEIIEYHDTIRAHGFRTNPKVQ